MLILYHDLYLHLSDDEITIKLYLDLIHLSDDDMEIKLIETIVLHDDIMQKLVVITTFSGMEILNELTT
ncbi:MAG: hypothetical protein WCG25_06755 [bacterium]